MSPCDDCSDPNPRVLPLPLDDTATRMRCRSPVADPLPVAGSCVHRRGVRRHGQIAAASWLARCGGTGRQNELMSLRLCILLWECARRAHILAAFEDAVLALLPDHGGRLLARDSVVDRRDGDPLEVQLIEMPDEEALAGYLRDPVRADFARTHDRDAVIARTQLLRVEPRG